MHRQHRGFTLIELMIVIAIIAVIAAIAIPNLLAAKVASNETSALATLRTIVSAETMLATSASLDCDRDGRGEYGTILEMTSLVGLRGLVSTSPPASDFPSVGGKLNPTVLQAVMGRVDPNGYCSKAGYAFRVYLPDTAATAGFAHEINTAPATSDPIAALSAPVHIDLSEIYWCVYADPISIGASGNRRFFANQRAELAQSLNEIAKAQGTDPARTGRDAFLGAGITSPAAMGTKGSDNELWKTAN